jgi:hypothetical protein
MKKAMEERIMGAERIEKVKKTWDCLKVRKSQDSKKSDLFEKQQEVEILNSPSYSFILEDLIEKIWILITWIRFGDYLWVSRTIDLNIQWNSILLNLWELIISF